MRLFALLLTLLPLAAHAQSGTAFTYQGRLDDNGVAVNVNHDFQFRLCGDAACTSGGTLVQRDAVQVRTGVFTTAIDFGAAFAGQSAFLEIATRRSGSGNPFQLLLPRQSLVPVPGAQHAQVATVADTNAVNSAAIVDNSIVSADIANGSVTGVDIDPSQVQQRVASTCAAGSSIRSIASNGTVACEPDDVGTINAWSRDGNAGTNPPIDFLGTVDDKPFEIRVNSVRAFRATPADNGAGDSAMNIVAGPNTFDAGVEGGTVAGGGGILDNVVGINRISGDYGTIGGGYNNRAHYFGTIVGGRDNVADIGGTAIGSFNVAAGEGSVAMGLFAKVRSVPGSGIAPEGTSSADNGTFVFADNVNADFVSTGGKQFLVRAGGGVAFTNAQLPAGQPSNGEFLVDAANGVGINVRDPGGTLHVRRGTSGATFGSGNAAVFEGASATFVRIVSPSTSERGVLFGDEDSSANGGIVYNSGLPNGLQFRTGGNNTRMSITASGKVGIGRAPDDASGNALEVNGTASKSAAGSWLANSDARIKRQVAPVASALDTLMRVRPVTFRYTPEYLAAHPELSDERYYNVVAQEFAQVFPDAVTPSGETVPGAAKGTPNAAILQVDTYPALITAIAAIQELSVRNERLEQRNAELEARIARLERK